MVTLNATNYYGDFGGTTFVGGNATLAIPTITNKLVACPIGYTDVVTLGDGGDIFRGTLLLTGTESFYNTDRTLSVSGLYSNGSGGAIGVQNAGTKLYWSGQIVGGGSLIKTGAGTLELSNENNYVGGTYVEEGLLRVGRSGEAILAGTDVTVSAGATFEIGPGVENNDFARLGKVILNGGTFRTVGNPGISLAFYINGLEMNGGTLEMLSGFGPELLTLYGPITSDSSSTTAILTSGTNCFLRTALLSQPMIVNKGSTPSGIDLDAGILFYPAGSNWVKSGAGTMRLTNLNNYADFVVQEGALRVDDVSDGVGPLGSGGAHA